jgi:hypothetical protein
MRPLAVSNRGTADPILTETQTHETRPSGQRPDVGRATAENETALIAVSVHQGHLRSSGPAPTLATRGRSGPLTSHARPCSATRPLVPVPPSQKVVHGKFEA